MLEKDRPVSLIVHTVNSVYEVGDKAIRRLNGHNDPTPRQGKDGEWQEFVTCTEPKIGESFVIGWRIEDGVLKSTITSMVTRIEKVGHESCRHCGRAIVNEGGTWIDPNAPATPEDGDDHIWRETCDSNDTFTAEHEPEEQES